MKKHSIAISGAICPPSEFKKTLKWIKSFVWRRRRGIGIDCGGFEGNG